VEKRFSTGSNDGRAAIQIINLNYLEAHMQTTSNFPSANSHPAESTPILSLFLRLYWMMIGHIVIAGLGCIIIFYHQDFSGLLLNLLYFGAVLLNIAVRYIDIRYYKGQTAEAEPATMAHWRRFSLLVICYSIPLWVVALLIMKAGLF
jgi:hypothetical protein